MLAGFIGADIAAILVFFICEFPVAQHVVQNCHKDSQPETHGLSPLARKRVAPLKDATRLLA